MLTLFQAEDLLTPPGCHFLRREPVSMACLYGLDYISRYISLSEKYLLPGQKLSLQCSTFNFEQNDVFLRYHDRIFVSISIPEGNNVTLARTKHCLMANWVNGLIGTGKRAL